MRTALVTGASGFLGGYITRELAAANWRVVGIDRTDLPPAEIDRRRLADLRVIELPAPNLEELLAALVPEVIVHAAGPASVPRSVANPAADFRESTLTLLNVLDAVRRTGLTSRVVFLSSAAVYGNPTRLPVKEDAVPDPISPYGFHKHVCENLIAEYFRVYGMAGCCVRIFSAYGPGLRRQVLWDICRKLLHNPAVDLLGTGEETRDFVHAADVAGGISAVIEHGEFKAEAYNLATGLQTSIRDLARMLADALGRRPEIVFSQARRTGDPIHWRADISRLAGLGFAPCVSITNGVAEYADWVLKAPLEPIRFT